MNKWILQAVTSAVVLLILSACGAAEPYEYNGTILESTAPTYNLTGIDKDGSLFQLAEQQGKFVMLNFGYTSCPDICPLTLGELSQVYRGLEEEELADQVEVVFVSVDPERDTPDRLNTYTNAFHEEFHGIYIEEPEEMERTKAAFGVFSEKVEPEDGDMENYLINHTGGTYVVGPNGNMRLFLRYDPEMTPEMMLEDMKNLIQQG